MTDQRPVTVLLVDDNAVVRRGLRSLLESEPGLHVVGEAWDGDRAVELTRALQPDVVLLDVQMPHRDGVSAAQEIAASSRVLMTTFTDDADVVRAAVAAGARGYLVHGSFDADELAGTVQVGGPWHRRVLRRGDERPVGAVGEPPRVATRRPSSG